MLIDLTRLIEHRMPVFPGDEETDLLQSRHYRIDHYNNHQLNINMHAGTHIDGPMHLTDSTIYLHEFPIDTFVGEGCLIDASDDGIVDYKAQYEQTIRPNGIVVVHTGHGKLFGQNNYFTDYPVLSVAFAELLVRKRVKMVCLDTPSPDTVPYEVHKLLFDNRILIAENLANVEQLIGLNRFEIIALPLHIKADSSIARIIARVI